jgi:acetyl esterase/lipase
MDEANGRDGVAVPARVIPTPRTVSAEARAFLMQMGQAPRSPEPSPTDIPAWRNRIAQGDAQLGLMATQYLASYPADFQTHRLSSADLYEVLPENAAPRHEHRVLLYVHGGAYIIGGGLLAAHMALQMAGPAQMRTFSIDYRMPPDAPYPAGLDDAVEAYRFVLERYQPQCIAIYGGSAGGGLAASMLLKARDEGLPMPGACILSTPELDLTESGDTFETNDTIDVVLKGRLTNANLLYAAGHDLAHPYLSAINGDFSKGYPPTMLTAGTRDLFLSNAVRMHRALRRAALKAELHVFEAMPHGGFFGAAPEDREMMDEKVRFLDENLALR